ncbi:uncharacterized protein TRAVEDRAFT_73326 [Trametes versicolor FP-101664 SS1]|uniref:uncharacterized protein n=1 Tax=Trametes versicolor (strain FP-101664) TaxID=717944 RepID=UPI0004623F56|nr:uncharacterized protein TRAVEDRAFT_73326 [Trametes versicolor FP-101664 SS1]EIW57075.1 hypothetical protein TRAVEDRAFT_73326 [Trametes versicolor FP-101664 SS1]
MVLKLAGSPARTMMRCPTILVPQRMCYDRVPDGQRVIEPVTFEMCSVRDSPLPTYSMRDSINWPEPDMLHPDINDLIAGSGGRQFGIKLFIMWPGYNLHIEAISLLTPDGKQWLSRAGLHRKIARAYEAFFLSIQNLKTISNPAKQEWATYFKQMWS